MTQFINDPTLPKPSFPGSHMVVDDHYMLISGLTVADLSNGAAARGEQPAVKCFFMLAATFLPVLPPAQS